MNYRKKQKQRQTIGIVVVSVTMVIAIAIIITALVINPFKTNNTVDQSFRSTYQALQTNPPSPTPAPVTPSPTSTVTPVPQTETTEPTQILLSVTPTTVKATMSKEQKATLNAFIQAQQSTSQVSQLTMTPTAAGTLSKQQAFAVTLTAISKMGVSGNNPDTEPTVVIKTTQLARYGSEVKSAPRVVGDSQENIYTFYLDGKEQKEGDIFLQVFGFAALDKMKNPMNLTTEGQFPETITAKSWMLLKRPGTDFFNMYYAGYPVYGGSTGAVFQKNFSDGSWYGRKNMVSTDQLDIDWMPAYDPKGFTHLYTFFNTPKIDGFPLDSSFKIPVGAGYSEKTHFIIDKDNGYHIFLFSNSLIELYSPVAATAATRKWTVQNFNDILNYDAYLGDRGDLVLVYQNKSTLNLLTWDHTQKAWGGTPVPLNNFNGNIVDWRLTLDPHEANPIVVIYNKKSFFNLVKIQKGVLWTMDSNQYSLKDIKFDDTLWNATQDNKDQVYFAFVEDEGYQSYVDLGGIKFGGVN